jgi:hypothetical protein
MKLQSFKDNSDSILINIKDMMLRCDIHQRYLDLLYLHRFSHQRVIQSKPLQEIVAYDLEHLLQSAYLLICEFTVAPHHIINVYRHDRNDRFVLLECTKGLWLEIDKELNGLRDRSNRGYSSMYKRKPDNYYKGAAIKEYQRIHKEIRRTFDLTKRIIRLKQNHS